MQVQSLGHEDPLEKEMATHSSILACKIPWTEEPGWLQYMGLQRVGHDLLELFAISFFKGYSQPKDHTGVSCTELDSLLMNHQGRYSLIPVNSKIKCITGKLSKIDTFKSIMLSI